MSLLGFSVFSWSSLICESVFFLWKGIFLTDSVKSIHRCLGVLELIGYVDDYY